MMKWKRIVSAAVCVCMAGMLITGCGSKSDSSSKKRIIRVALSQSEEHPEYKGMETFKKYVEEGEQSGWDYSKQNKKEAMGRGAKTAIWT